MNIFLQKLAPIQKRTSPTKFDQLAESKVRYRTFQLRSGIAEEPVLVGLGRSEDASVSVAAFSPGRRRQSARTQLTWTSTSTTVLSEGLFREPWTPSDNTALERSPNVNRFCPRLEEEVVHALENLAEKQAQAARKPDPSDRAERVRA